jgi:hypothetical protein
MEITSLILSQAVPASKVWLLTWAGGWLHLDWSYALSSVLSTLTSSSGASILEYAFLAKSYDYQAS